jgi:hypothetical protein
MVCNIYEKCHVVGEACMIVRMLQIVCIIKEIRPSLLDKVFRSSFFPRCRKVQTFSRRFLISKNRYWFQANIFKCCAGQSPTGK